MRAVSSARPCSHHRGYSHTLRRKAEELNAILATTSKDFARLNEDQREGVAALKVRLAWGEGSTAALDELLRPLLDEGRVAANISDILSIFSVGIAFV